MANTDFDTTLLDSSAKNVRVALKDIDDVEHLNALLDCEKNDFEKPRTTVVTAINERIAALVVDDDSGSGNDDGDASGDDGSADGGSDLDDVTAPAATPKAREKKDLTTGPARLGKTARRAVNAISDLNAPPAPMVQDESDDAPDGAMVPATDDDGNEIPAPDGVFPTAGEVAEKLGVKTSQVRSILRTLRARKLVALRPALSPEDRTFRYEVAEGAVERIAEGDAERAKAGGSSTPKVTVKVDPMPEEEYAPLARKVGTLDRLIVRWSGTNHRERRAIDKEHGEGASKDATHWSINEIELDGETVTGTAKEIVSALRDARNAIMSNSAFNAAQAVEENTLLVVIKDANTVVDDSANDSTNDGDDDDGEE